MSDVKRKSASRNGARNGSTEPDWIRIAAVTAGVVGTALLIGAVVRHRTARRVGMIGLAALAERNADRIVDATQAIASRWWPRVSAGVAEVVRKPAALLGH
ncbi:MAG TPA: hypothetical protein VND91_01470 [Candidatus Saccharimonadia bacterium]|nr:hypothetical protein [Candidatus Saccharimonadia bacterium]